MRWHECTLQEIGKLARGRSRHRPRYAFHLYGGPYPFIQTGEIREAKKYINCYTQTYSEDGLKQSKIWPKGTLCITIAANIAEIGILDFDACFPDSVLGFIPNQDKADLNFIYYTLIHYKRELQYLGEGSVQDNINLGTFENMKFPIPSLPEQRAIAAVLSSLDDKIDLLHRQNATLEAMAEALFRQWFVVEAKEEWEEKSLQDEFNIFIGRTPPRKEQNCFSFDNGEKWISIKDMGAPGIFISDSSEYLTQQAINNYRIPLIPKNSVVLSFKMTVGRVKITTAPMYSNEAIACFVPNSTTYLSKEFLYLFLKQYKFDELGTTSSIVTAINSNMIKNIIFKLPPESLLKMFTQQSEKLFVKIRFNQAQIRTLEKLRDTLLPKLMSGEVRVAIS